MRAGAILLCAGASMRMGAPKALLRVGGTTFLERAVAAFEGAGVNEIAVVIAEPDGARIRAEAGGDAAAECAVRWVENLDPGEGPISSIRAGIAAPWREPIDLHAIHPVDIPGITAADVRALLAAARDTPDSDAWIPSVDRRRAHPVLLRRALAERVLALPSGKTLRDLLAQPDVRIHHVPSPNTLLLLDVDTPADLRTLESLLP